MSAERIDVRALIKKAADVLDEDYFQMAAVEAAVAELIEAAKEAERDAAILGMTTTRLTAALARMGAGA